MNAKAKTLAVGIITAFALTLANSAWAGLGMSTRFGMVTLENIQPGETINTRQIANLPYVITNRSSIPLLIKIGILKPKKDKGMKQLGYEPIPDTSWVKLSDYELSADAGQEVATDVIISIPDEDKYLGKKYQVNLHATAKGKQLLGVGLMSKLRITIASRRLTEEECIQRKRIKEMTHIDFDLSPNILFIEDVPVGTKFSVTKERKERLKLTNPNDEDLIYLVRVGTAKTEDMGLVPGYENTPNPKFLKLSETAVKVRANTIKKIHITFDFPMDEKYKGKKYMFIVKGEISGAPIALRKLTRVLVSTRP